MCPLNVQINTQAHNSSSPAAGVVAMQFDEDMAEFSPHCHKVFLREMQWIWSACMCVCVCAHVHKRKRD